MLAHGKVAAGRPFELCRQRAPISVKREAFNGWQPTQRSSVAVQPAQEMAKLAESYLANTRLVVFGSPSVSNVTSLPASL